MLPSSLHALHEKVSVVLQNNRQSLNKKALLAANPSTIFFLDGLRGLAIILVLLEHASYAGKVHLGAAGVDIFFVLSAFLLTMNTQRKFQQLRAQKATSRHWFLALLDYFSKRFLRVYPLFALTAVGLAMLPDDLQNQYFLTHKLASFDLFKVLTFQTDWRYHVFWTLPLEISYYFLIPVFSLAVIKLHKLWWVAFLPLYGWIVYNGFTGCRKSHAPLKPHLPTFISGSMAAVIYLQIDSAGIMHLLQLCDWQRGLLNTARYLVLALLVLTVGFNGWYLRVFFDDGERRHSVGSPFVSVLVTIIIVTELLLPSNVGSVLESGVLCYWGKISFSAYLLHSFVVYTESVRMQPLGYRIFSVVALTMLMATISHQLVETPMQQLARLVSRAIGAANQSTDPCCSVRYRVVGNHYGISIPHFLPNISHYDDHGDATPFPALTEHGDCDLDDTNRAYGPLAST